MNISKIRLEVINKKFVGDYMQYFAWYFMEFVSKALSWDTINLQEVAK